MGKRGGKGTAISRLGDIRGSSYRKARGFSQCQPAQWSQICAGELALLFGSAYVLILLLVAVLSTA